MTEENKEEVKEVVCTLTGETTTSDKTFSYETGDGEVRYVSVNAGLKLIELRFLPIVIENFAKNDTLFNEVKSVRRELIAKSKGIQDGATQTVNAIKEAATELGVNLDDVIKKAFTPKLQPEAPVNESPVEDQAVN